MPADGFGRRIQGMAGSSPAATPKATSWKRHLRFRWSLLLLFCFVIGGAVGWVVRRERVVWARRKVLGATMMGDYAMVRKCIRIDPGLLGVIEDLGTSALHRAA